MSFQENLCKIAVAISEQRHLAAIRNAFYKLMPLMLVASLYVLINNVVLTMPGLRDIAFLQAFRDVGDRIFRGTLGMVSIGVGFLVAYYLAAGYKAIEDAPFYGLTSIGCIVVTIPGVQQVTIGETVGGLWGILQFTDTGAAGMFVAIIVGILSAELLHALGKMDSLKIHLPESVPPAVAKSFSALIPITLTFTVFGVFAFLLDYSFKISVSQIIIKTLQAPVIALLQDPIGLIFVVGIQTVLWFVGVHGSFVMGPLYEPPLLVALQENLTNIQNGIAPIHIVTKPFIDSYMNMGGAGNSFGLILAIFIFSRRDEDRLIGKISFAPGLFNINEPLLFGLPMIFNPLYLVPMILSPIANGLIAYAATATGMVNKISIIVPWTTPPVISAYLASGSDIRAAVLSLVLVVVSIVIYAPFVIAANSVKKL